jgi:hypothetical protein
MLASVVAAYDRLLVWLGFRSRHASRATAATPREYRGRHATNTLARDLADAVAAGAITVNQARQNAKITAMDLLGIAPNMPDPRPVWTAPNDGLFNFGDITNAQLAGIKTRFDQVKNGPTRWIPNTSEPRPGSLPELGQRIADGLMPWFDKAADTVTLPSLQVDWREGRTEQPMTRYGRADKL